MSVQCGYAHLLRRRTVGKAGNSIREYTVILDIFLMDQFIENVMRTAIYSILIWGS